VALTGYLVDTSALAKSEHAPRVQTRIEELATQRLLYRCGVIELEILRSARSPAEYEQRRTDLSAAFVDLPITPRVIARSLEVQRALAAASQHRGVSLPDLIIAACAEVHDAAVVHYDADYDRIAAITGQPVEWVVPSGSVERPATNAAPDQAT
jgi:predicted nucleic acid-binding protein